MTREEIIEVLNEFKEKYPDSEIIKEYIKK